MKYYIITRSEMELLEKAGLAVVACPKTKSGYDWSGVESITVEGKTYDSEIHYKEIKFRLNGELTTQLLFYKTNNKIELFNRVFVYDNAIKHFKIKNKKGNK